MTTKTATTKRLPVGPRPYLYFAYGSNLDRAAMKHRCPAAEPVAPYELPDHRLVFRGVADVVEDPKSVVLGGLWRITDECERSLNSYEGYRVDQSGLYNKVRIVDPEWGEIMFYKMNDKLHRRMLRIYPPDKFYLGTIIRGYKDFGLNTDSLFQSVIAATQAVEHDRSDALVKMREELRSQS